MKKIKYGFIILVLITGLIGCSNHVKLSGKVTYSDTGEPLESGTVIFLPESETFQARGEIEKNGSYVLATFKENDGLPPGNYRVYVNSAYRYETRENAPTAEIRLVTDKFTSPETSGLVFKVDSSTRNFDFQVDRAPGSKKKN
ncbi:MAG: carboxypeptidase-like regulatory domain-containing protein [Planctomycetaceae bacterium]|jgi:hypothetical protein|nr:carboxypeptidase-like regulatory domain-containing protein [Planctomycetaceae bacterium]